MLADFSGDPVIEDEARVTCDVNDRSCKRHQSSTAFVTDAVSRITADTGPSIGTHKRQRYVDAAAYYESYNLVVGEVNLQGDRSEPGVAGELVAVAGELVVAGVGTFIAAGELAVAAGRVRSWLQERGFCKDTRLVVVFRRATLPSDNDELNTAGVEALCGVYYRKPDAFQGHPCYQKVEVLPSILTCSPLHIFWSLARNGWKIGQFNDRKAGYAFRVDEEELSLQSAEPWMLLKAAS